MEGREYCAQLKGSAAGKCQASRPRQAASLLEPDAQRGLLHRPQRTVDETDLEAEVPLGQDAIRVDIPARAIRDALALGRAVQFDSAAPEPALHAATG